MVLIELSSPSAEPVSLAQAKAFARIERSDEDALLASLISAARETVERETGLVLAPRSFRLVADIVPTSGRLASSVSPLLRVTGVRSYDEAGTETVLAQSAVTIEGGNFVLSPPLRTSASVEIEFEAGDDRVPEALLQAILRIVAASYETRGLVGADLQPALVPAFAKALLGPFRRVRL